MIRMLCAHTNEIDDADAAVTQILEQLNIEQNLLKNAVGIISCFPDFLHTGVVAALNERLPFETLGCTTLGAATAHEAGMMMLGITVLTSDDLTFATAVSGSLFTEQQRPIEEAYNRGRRALGREPALLIPFLPLIEHVGGENLYNHLRAASGDVPAFGTLACDQHLDYHDSHVLWCGKHYRDAMALLLIAGDISPRFALVSIPEAKVQKHRAIITRSEGNILHRVNDMPLMDFMEHLGLAESGKVEGTSAIPFVVDFGDGSRPAARAIYMITESGEAICGGTMPEGATLAIGSIDYNDVLETTQDLIADIKADTHVQGALIFSCLSRNLVLGADVEAELDTYRSALGDSIPYLVAYAGGEICPVYTSGGQIANRFHNFTAIACLF